MQAASAPPSIDLGPLPKRWSETDASRVLEAYRHSGLSARAFAHAAQISLDRMYYWRNRLASDETSDDEPLQLVQVTLTSPVPEPVSVQPLEVVLPSGCSVRVPDSFRTDTLQRLLAVLEGTC